MSSWGGVAQVAKQIDDLHARVASFTVAVAATVPQLDILRGKLQEVAEAGREVQKVIGEAGGIASSTETPREQRDSQIVGYLSGLEERLKQKFGDNNFVAALIEQRLGYVQSGQQSAEDALSFIRQYLAPYLAGLMNEAASSTDAAIRELDNELERLINSGLLNPTG